MGQRRKVKLNRFIWDLLALATALVSLATFAGSDVVCMDDGTLAHPGAAEAIQDEHTGVFSLVPYATATDTAVADGLWSDPAVWLSGTVPAAGAEVVIAEFVTVTVDSEDRTVYDTVRVDGTLRFATNVDTALIVDTLVVGITGHLVIGTADNPVAAGVQAKIIIADTGPIDLAWDPRELSRGLISHGSFTAHGQVKTTHADLAEPARRRAKHLVLDQVPENWQIGDVLILPGNHSRRDFDETLLVTGIDGTRVDVVGVAAGGGPIANWRGLSNRHTLPEGLTPFVINVSRNVVIESENVTHADDFGINRRRGHVMFMHSGVSKSDARYIGSYGMGRTDKRTPLESPELDENGVRTDNRGHNAAGRYAWHYHRGGPHNSPAILQGLAIVDSPGLGVVNHSSNVEASDCVAYNVVGSAFFTEAGHEVGFFQRCAAVRMPGSGEGVGSRSKSVGVIGEQDFGHAGHGFWLQGGGVSLHDVRVAGAASSGIIFFTVALEEGGGLGKATFPGELLHDAVAMGKDQVAVGTVPITLDGAFVFGCRSGIQTKFHQLGSKHQERSLIHNAVTVNTGTPLTVNYTNQLTISDSAFIGNLHRVGGRFMKRNKVTRNLHFEDLVIRGFGQGIDIPLRGDSRVVSGTFQNARDIIISTTRDANRLTQILGSPTFLELSDAQRTFRGVIRGRHHVHLVTNFSPDMNDLTRLFARDVIRLGTMMYKGTQLFYHAQAADYVPFPAESAEDYVPARLIGYTNAELWAIYGLAIGDAIAPDDAYVDPQIHALIGAPISYPPRVALRGRRYTNRLNNVRVRYYVIYEDGTRVKRTLPGRVNLNEGWNITTFEEAGHLRSVMMFGDLTAPSFIPSPGLPGVLNPADLKRGFRVTGTIVDNSFGTDMFKKKYSGAQMLSLPVQTRADGSTFIELSFSVRDLARNSTPVVLPLELDAGAPLAHENRRRQLDSRPVVDALNELLGLS